MVAVPVVPPVRILPGSFSVGARRTMFSSLDSRVTNRVMKISPRSSVRVPVTRRRLPEPPRMVTRLGVNTSWLTPPVTMSSVMAKKPFSEASLFTALLESQVGGGGADRWDLDEMM